MGDECDRLLRYFPGLEVGGPTWAASRRVVMDKHDNGDWVRYEDARTRIATLESQLAASEAKCAELELECENAYVKIVDEREAYGSQLAAANEKCLNLAARYTALGQRAEVRWLEEKLAASEAKCAEAMRDREDWFARAREQASLAAAALTRAEEAKRLAVPIDAFEVVKSIQGPLWDAIHRFTAGCGGDVSRHVYGNVARMNAVAEVNEVIRAALRQAEGSE